ncbi:beta strand repeat-containing protein [Spirosoma radiotolerans]|uniref:Ig-like domain-containing protein n=1 Tax=Spirosoma radiotolerans TaxID=1379870 RepID=A0A0E3ZRI4_9BACT|nr:SprB repeat-containing protein [Spirosoma radiotolerans]AKD53814.1 hypothetical protein SD10_01750 [Spirosoma radiotolerans]
MKAVEKVMWFRPWILLLLLLGGAARPSVQAQNVPGCDPLGRTPLVDFQLTYDVVANQYTAWYVPTDNTLHRAVTGQFTIITPNGFTTPGSNGRDANFQITDINGNWSDFVIDNELITSAGQVALPALSGVAVHQVGMAPAGIDIDPDGAGPQTIATPVTAGVAVPLFSFPGTGCASVVRILVNGEPIQNAIMTFGSNVNNEITLQIPRAAGIPALERYCKNATLNTVALVLPDIQDDTQTLCATSSTYSNNYFTQVLRNWNPANLPAGSSVVATANQQWGSFTVSPVSLQGNVSLNPGTGAYTLTYPTVGGVIQPGSLTICNTLGDKCNTASDGACVVISWVSSGSVSIAATGPNCVSNGPASVTLTSTSGFSSYSWLGSGLTVSSGNPVTATLSSAGVYSYTVIAANATGCSTTATTSFTLANKPVIASVTSTNPTSCPGTDGVLTLSGLVAGQTYAINYSKNGASPISQNLTATGSGQISLSGLTTGVYSISASAGGCTSDPVSATLIDPTPPVAPTVTVNPLGSICLGSSVILTATGAVGASFNWTGSTLSQSTGSSVTATPATAGSFVYTVSQTVAGCNSLPASVTVTVNPKPGITLSALSTTVCVGGSIGLTASPSGGLPGYTFAWSGPNFSTTSTVSTISIPNASISNSGIYSVIVTDANQCSTTATTPVAINVINCCSLSATVATSQSTICVGSTVTLSVNVSGNTGPLTFQWSPAIVAPVVGSPGGTVSPTATTTYTVVVTDTGVPNCSRTATVTVTVNQPPVVQAALSSGTVCLGSSVNLTATINTNSVGPYSFSWKGPNGYTSSQQNPIIASAQAIQSGSYTVVVTDANGCSITATTPLALSVINCPVPCPAPIGFNLVVTAAQCGSATGQITATPASGLAPYSYVWSNGQSGQTISGLLGGVYSVTITDANGCTGVSGSINLPGSQAPMVRLVSVAPAACGQSTGAISVSASGGLPPYAYQWSNGLSGSSVSGLSAGVYTVSVSDGSGCASTLTVSVPGSSNLTLVASSLPAACGQAAGSVSVSVSGGTSPYQYKWSNGAITASVSGLVSGAYSVTVSDGGGCSSVALVNVNSVSGPVLTLSSVDAACNASASGSASVSVSGGSGPYSYFWSNGRSGQTISGLVAGVYSVTVVDGNGCRASGQVTVGQPAMILAIYSPARIVCPSTVGSITQVSISGGTAPYSYSWSNGATSAGLNNVGAGSYTVTITDARGCVATGTATLTPANCPPVCPPLGINLVVTAAECGSATGQITASLTSGTAPYTYVWSNGQNGPTITGLSSGVYSVTVTDGNGCTGVSGSINLPGSQAPAVSLVSVSPAACGQATGGASVSASGGLAPYSYSWSNGASTSSVSGLSVGTYTVRVLDGSGCQGLLTVVVPGSSSLSLTASATPAACGSASGSAGVVVSGGTRPYQYKWSNGAITASVSGLVSGAYSVSVTDAGGCSATATVNVNSVSGPSLSVNSAGASCNATASGSATAVVSGGLAPYSYSWSNGASTSSVSGLTAGTYTVRVTDGNGCQASQQVVISQPAAILAIYSPARIVCPSTVGSITQVSISGGTAPYSYSWSNGATTPGLTGVSSGTYTVTITDARGCVATGSAVLVAPTCPVVCEKPVLTVSTPICNSLGTGYTVSFTSSSTNVTVNTGTISGNTITVNGLTDLVVTANNGLDCFSRLTVLAPTSCPTPGSCTLVPTLTVGQPACLGTGQYTVSVNGTNGTISTSAGTLSGNTVTANIGTNLVITITGANGCGSYSVGVVSPASCTTSCTNPLVSVSGPVCGSNGVYAVNVTPASGVSLVVSGGTLLGNVITATTGTPVSITARNGSCADQVVVIRPPVCPPACTQQELIVFSTPVCQTATQTYSVNYVATPGTVIATNAGNTAVVGIITGIPVGIVLSVTATNGTTNACPQVKTVNPPAGCSTVVCPAPMLTFCSPLCNPTTGGFTFTFITNGTSVTASNGATVDMKTGTVTVPAGVTAVTVTAINSQNGCYQTTSFTVGAPTGCTVCKLPSLFVCQPVCNGDGTYSVGYLVSPGASVTAIGGVISAGNRITAPVGTKVTVIASNGPGCSIDVVVNSPASCSVCVQPGFGISGIICRNNGASYDVQYITNSTSGTVTASKGKIVGNAVVDVPSGQPVILTLTNNSCPPVSITIAAPTSCTPSCVTLELKVLLEGPYNTTTHLMNTTLNSRGLLPGQTPIGMFAVPTPAGQPYNTAPWNYTGTESITNYPADVVDWVLVSLRTDSLTTNTAFRVAGLLHSDGRISFVNPCFSIPNGTYFPVIEHRNHMGVMSPTRVPVVNNKLIFDFTTQNSYMVTNPPSFGEIQIDNRWMMYGGDGKKDTYTDDFDINFFDSKLWKDESGIFDQYRLGDFNMDADVNFSDSVLWNKNNGRYSKVPH